MSPPSDRSVPGEGKAGSARLISGRLLARNSVLNLTTSGAILLGNVLFIPPMLRTFGMELYGVLAVTWMVLGHIRFLDLGFSAACAKFVARDLSAGREEEAGRWAWVAVAVQASLGTVAAITLWVSAPYLADLLKIAPGSRDMAVMALQLFALVVPVDLSTRSFNSVLEATQKFVWINALSVFGAFWTYGTYALGIMRDGDFRAVVFGLVALRVVNLLVTFWLAGRVLPSVRISAMLRAGGVIDGARLREMFRFGGWVSVSNGIGPLIYFFDRWVISTVRGVALLPLYTVPLQMLMSLQLIPASASSTLFPAFSVMEASSQWERMQTFLVRAHRYLLLGLIPIMVVLFLWAEEILRLWIGADFAAGATLPFRILIVGFSVGLFAPFSGVLLQGAGRPDVLSKVYLVECPVNVIATIYLVREYGVVGAAAVCAGRTVIETVVLWVCIHRVFPLSWRRLASGTLERLTPVALVIAGLTLTFPKASIASVPAVAITVSALVAYALALRFYLLDDSDRAFMRSVLKRTRGGIHPGDPAQVV